MDQQQYEKLKEYIEALIDEKLAKNTSDEAFIHACRDIKEKELDDLMGLWGKGLVTTKFAPIDIDGAGPPVYVKEENMTILERVAKAINGPYEFKNQPVDRLIKLRDYRWQVLCSDQERGLLLIQARAAIEAMREPSEKMIEATGKRDLATGEIDDEVITDYQAMIDAALKE